MFSKKATKIDEIFTVNLTLCSKCQIVGEDFVKFCGLLRKHELYLNLGPKSQLFLTRRTISKIPKTKVQIRYLAYPSHCIKVHSTIESVNLLSKNC